MIVKSGKKKLIRKKLFERISGEFILNRVIVGFFFLGVGLTMFILNITTILAIMSIWKGGYPVTGYYISILSSIILMSYSLYNIYVE